MPRSVRTLEYRRASWLDEEQNLERLARAAWGQFGTQIERTIIRRDDTSTCGLSFHDFGHRGFAIHCARFKNRQSVATVPMNPVSAAQLGERPPESGENFMNSDFVALIKDNHLVVLNTGRNAGTLRDFLIGLFAKASFPEPTQQLQLVRIGNVDKLAMIEAVGVKNIDMKIAISEASASSIAEEDSNSVWSAAKQGVSNFVNSIVAQDEQIANLKLAEKGSVSVSINVARGDLEVAKDGLDVLAEAIAEDEDADDFVIQLRNTQTIRADEVTVRKKVSLEEVANSVSVRNTWDEMVTYYEELTRTGQVEV